MSANGYALGIDLGTTWTAAAIFRDGRAETVALGDRAHTVPSVILIEDDGSAVVGEPAAGRAAAEPSKVVREFKRSFGDDIGVLAGQRSFSAAEMTGMLLKSVLRRVIEAEGTRPQQVAVTVPATWRGYRTGLMESLVDEALAEVSPAGALVLPEPAAAAVHYAGRRRLDPGTTVGVYDFGGGTFDATVLRKTAGSFEIAGLPVGADDVGGSDLDHALLRRASVLLGPGFAALDRTAPAVRSGLVLLRDALVVAKEALSSSASVTVPVVLPGLPPSFMLTRDVLEQEARPLLERTLTVFGDAVALADLDLAALDAVLLVGGSSRIPLVARLLQERLGRPVTADTHPKYAVCLGAAISAGARLSTPSSRAATAWSPPIFQPAPEAPVFEVPAAYTPVDDAPPLRPGTVPEPVAVPMAVPDPQPLAVPQEPDAAGFVVLPRFGDERPAPTLEQEARTAVLVVDLAAAGLTSADEVPLRPAAELRRRTPDPAAAPMTIRLRDDSGYRTQTWSSAGRALALVLGLVLLAAVAVAVLTSFR